MIDIFSSNDDNLNFQKNGYIVKDVSEKLIDDLILVYKKVKPFFFFETMYFNLLNQNERNVIADREIRLIFSDFIKDIVGVREEHFVERLCVCCAIYHVSGLLP